MTSMANRRVTVSGSRSTVTNHAEVTTNQGGELETVNEYHILDPLGSGSFASVYCCVRKKDPSGTKYAVKVKNAYVLFRNRPHSELAGTGTN